MIHHSEVSFSEAQLQRKLDDARRLRRGKPAEIPGSQDVHRIVEVHLIECVKSSPRNCSRTRSVTAKFFIRPRSVLENPGTDECVPAEIAELPDRISRKRCRIEILIDLFGPAPVIR